MKMVKVKTICDSEIFVNLDRIDYVSLDQNFVYFSDRCVKLNDESVKKIVDLIEGEESEKT